jgi:type IV pilus assembly protein PilM
MRGKKYIPLPLSEMNLSWSIVSQNIASNTLKVVLTAVPKQVIANYTELFSSINLQLSVLDIEAFALSRSMVFDGGKNHAIIDIGAKSTSIIILKNGLLQLNRNVNVGGDTITARIAQSLNISENRAEQFKRDFGVSQATFLPDSIKPVLNNIKNEVKQLLALYQSQESKIDKVTLVGGGANLPGLINYWSDLGVPIELGNPLKTVAYSQASELHLKRFVLHLPVAIGLALRTES